MNKPLFDEQPNALAVQERPAAMTQTASIIQMAIAQNMGVEVIRELLQMKHEEEDRQARREFDAAKAAFKAEAVVIAKNIEVTNGPLAGKRYADLFAVVNSITPALSRHGLSLSWKLTKDEPQWLEVTCTLRHVSGHCETASMGGPPDKGGAKNAIQERASAKTYLERYTALAVLGMAAGGEDHDGRASAPAMGEDSFADWQEHIKGAADLDELKQRYLEAQAAAQKAGDKRAIAAFADAKNLRYKQLAQKGGAR